MTVPRPRIGPVAAWCETGGMAATWLPVPRSEGLPRRAGGGRRAAPGHRPGRPDAGDQRDRHPDGAGRRARRCCSSSRPGARCRWRSTCSAPSGGWRWRSGVDDAGRDRRPDRRAGQAGAAGRAGPASATASARCMQLKSVPPKKVKTAPCQEVVYKGDDVDLNRLPGLQIWPDDGGDLPQLRADPHQAPGDRQAQPRALPAAAALAQHARHALADPQGLHRAPRGRRAARASGCRSRSRSAATRWSPTRRPRRCPATSTSTCSPGSCAASGSRWSTA